MSELPSSPPALANFPVQISLPVLWGDMDALGHVNNTVSIRWFECGRIALMEHVGLAKIMTGERLGPILAAVHCNYRRQIHYPDQIIVGSRVERIGRSSMTIDHAIYSQRHSAIAADGQSIVVVFDYQAQRPVRIPDAFAQALERLQQSNASDLPANPPHAWDERR